MAVTAASTTTIQNSSAPSRPAPKSTVGIPRPMNRSARCAMPTLHSSPRPSARARVYETSIEAERAAIANPTASGIRAAGTPPWANHSAIPRNTAVSPTRSSVES